MGVKTQLAMIAALGCAALLLLRWSPSDPLKINYGASLSNMRGLLGEGGKGTHKACAVASPRPPVSIEWTGRESMTVSYKEGVDVEVYKHEFPGSTLCACHAASAALVNRPLAMALYPLLHTRRSYHCTPPPPHLRTLSPTPHP